MRIDPTVYDGRPADESGRLPREIACYDLLDRLQLPYRRVDHEAADTIDACQQIERAQDLLEQGVYSVEQYSERFAKHSGRLREIDASLADLQQRIDARPQYCTLDEISPAIRALLDDYDAMSALQRNGLLKQCVSRIVYHKSKSTATSGSSAPANFVLDVFPRLK